MLRLKHGGGKRREGELMEAYISSKSIETFPPLHQEKGGDKSAAAATTTTPPTTTTTRAEMKPLNHHPPHWYFPFFPFSENSVHTTVRCTASLVVVAVGVVVGVVVTHTLAEI